MKTKLNRILLNKAILFQILIGLCAFLFVGSVVFAAPSDDFVITVKTDNPGVSSDKQFEIPTYPHETYNYNVDCNNDGTNEATGVTDNYTCNYPTAGTYTIRIKDNTETGNGFPRIYFHDFNGNSSDAQKLLSVNQWGTGHWTSMRFAFTGCSNLNSASAVNNGGGAVPDWATDTPDLSGVTDMTSMFRGASSFNQDVGSWNVSNVTNMNWMFFGASAFNQDIGNWHIDNVTNIRSMFYGASAFNQDIGNWHVDNVTDMAAMFWGASSFNQDISAWNVSNVTNMYGMFYKAYSFNQDIGSWHVDNVTNMKGMFEGAILFNQDISGWNVSNVTNMQAIFYDAYSFNQDISGWNVSNVTNMRYMFHKAYSFNQDISGWDVSNVTNMYGMFYGAFSFNQNIGSWDVSNVTNMTQMFSNSGMSTDNYDDTLIGWSARNLQDNVTLDLSAHYCRSETQRQHIIDTYHWTINDAGKSCVTKINVPSGQHTYTYRFVVAPSLNIDSAIAKPFASGYILGKILNLRVGFRAFADPVDIYLAISYSGLPGDIFLIDSSNGLQKNTIVPWKTNQTAAISESLYGNINTSGLPEGTYTLYTLVVPAGATNMDNSYLWITNFNISH